MPQFNTPGTGQQPIASPGRSPNHFAASGSGGQYSAQSAQPSNVAAGVGQGQYAQAQPQWGPPPPPGH